MKTREKVALGPKVTKQLFEKHVPSTKKKAVAKMNAPKKGNRT